MSFKFNPITGQLDLVRQAPVIPGSNFSYYEIDPSESITIAQGQQMLLDGSLVLEGELNVEGQAIFDAFGDEFNFSIKKVKRPLRVPSNQQMIVDGNLILENSLTLEGELSIINDERKNTVPAYFIESGRSLFIGPHREYFLATSLYNEGQIVNDGRLVIGEA